VKKIPDTRSEFSHQCSIFLWAAYMACNYPELILLNGSLNGVRLPWGLAKKAKAAGMKKGYPDLFLPVARGGYHGLFMELKVKRNYCTPAQRWWLEALRKQGYYAVSIRGEERAKVVIIDYLNGHYVRSVPN